MEMPFGKYKGIDMEEVPNSYIIWLHENTELREPLKSYIDYIVDTALKEEINRAKSMGVKAVKKYKHKWLED